MLDFFSLSAQPGRNPAQHRAEQHAAAGTGAPRW